METALPASTNTLTLAQIQRVYQRIVKEGVKLGDRYHLSGLIASAGFDGHSVSINNEDVYLHVFFDRDFAFDCDSEADRDAFVVLLRSLDPECTAEQLFL